MRDDVITTISSAKAVNNAIILTHNIDFVFIQTVVLAAFKRCGHSTITIFADASCAAETFAHQAPVLTGLGVRYRVVPVSMSPGFRFHPKAVFLSSKSTATMLVGSGNLTFGGWRENAEIWTRFDTHRDGVAPFLAFHDYLKKILDVVTLPDAVRAEVDAAFDANSKTWISQDATPAGLIGRVASGSILLNQMVSNLGDAPVDEIYLCSPYFDEEGIALQQIIDIIPAKRVTVLCQPERSTLTQKAWARNSSSSSLRRIDFSRPGISGKNRSAFIHAKMYAFRRGDQITLFAGSANCSQAALTIPGKAGNAELLAIGRMTSEEFTKNILNEMEIADAPAELREDVPEDYKEASTFQKSIRIEAARFDEPNLLVAYSPPNLTIIECLIDSEPFPFNVIGQGVFLASCSTAPKSVVVSAIHDGELILSTPMWVDHERSLRTSSQGRNLADSIRVKVQPGVWDANGWTDVLDVFCKHLSYMPVAHVEHFREVRKSSSNETLQGSEFTASDVFSHNYEFPHLNLNKLNTCRGESSHIQSAQQLLLRWFGVPNENLSGETSDSDDVPHADDGADKPEQLHVPSTPTEETFHRDKGRIEKLLTQLEAAMLSKEFLERRPPDYLAADLKIISVLLRIGLRNRWIDPEQLSKLTQKIWCSLFFSSNKKEVGWLEYRVQTSDDTEAFIQEMQSAELSAALVGWKLAAPYEDNTPESVCFELAAVLSVARVPWLWHGGEPDKIADELAALISYSSSPTKDRDILARKAEEEWKLLLQRGHALRLLEAAAKSLSVEEISNRIGTSVLQKGDLLWQGTAGFCVVCEKSPRTDKKVKVLKLQKGGEEVKYIASKTIPIKALLDKSVLPHSEHFGDEPRVVLHKFIRGLSQVFA
ncbi:phospholipase D family protein [uncultured Pseudodesulfovibrio sp.]|uniref:phospholipase D family protein n=1 Tax=uncultured Pseudodesulfovibrio sp. TaxID=2035858 RepID=UPI0029C70144|nr:phospholipase D family protein [uncultured Pseudodesulfovibrio sp.]